MNEPEKLVPLDGGWAEGRSPVGAEECRAYPADESRTLTALRDALVPKLGSGGVAREGGRSHQRVQRHMKKPTQTFERPGGRLELPSEEWANLVVVAEDWGWKPEHL